MSDRPKLLITGGAGFIGTAVANRFRRRGWQVTILDNLDPQVHPAGSQPPDPPGQRLIVGDVRDRAALDPLVAEADLIVHAAAAVGVGQSLYRVHHYSDVNVTGTASLLDSLIEHRVRGAKMVLLTSMTAYGEGLYRHPADGQLLRPGVRSAEDVQRHGWEPACPVTGDTLEPLPVPEDARLEAQNIYALTKRYQEDLARSVAQTFELPVVSLRLFNVYGPGQSLSNPYSGVLAIFLSHLLAGRRPLVFEDGRQTRDFVSVHDVARAIELAAESPAAAGQVFNIGSQTPRAIADCGLALARQLGRAELRPRITGQFRSGDIRHCTADIGRARQVLGFRPETPWEEGLAELVEWASEEHSEDRNALALTELDRYGLMTHPGGPGDEYS